DSNSVVGSVFGDPGKLNNQSSLVLGPTSANLYDTSNGGTDATGRYNGIFGNHFMLDAQFGYHEEKNVQTGENSNFTHRHVQTGQLTEYFPDSGWAGLNVDEKYKRYAYRAAGSLYFGTHELKVGGDYESIQSSFLQSYHGGRVEDRFNAAGGYRFTVQRYYGAYPATLNCLQRVDGSRPPQGTYTPLEHGAGYYPVDSIAEPDTRNLAFFAQDAWKVLPNLTVSAGIRWEQQKLKNAEGATVININDEWSPRAGVIWDPGNNGRAKVYGSFGRFYTT